MTYVLAISSLSAAYAARVCGARKAYMSRHWFIILAGLLLVFAFWPQLQSFGR